MKIKELHQLFLNASGICTDTRTIQKNCLFFALKGENFNGNKFTQLALKKGALKAIIDEKEFQTEDTVLVNNVLKTLQKLATYHRDYLAIPIIALTGSNGKTTTKELINAVLSTKHRTTATKGNLNNHIGVPLTLLSMNSKTEIGIVEMGANHPKEIEFLCELTKPDYGYITNFGKAHLEGFINLEGVINAKTELYNYLKENNKTVFVNADDTKQIERSEGINSVLFGGENKPSILLLNEEGPLEISFKKKHIKSNLVGHYNYFNLAAAISIGNYFKVTENQIKTAIEDYEPTNNRSQIINKGTNKIILDAYNANPTSMMAALQSIQKSSSKTTVLFLGDMFELGTEAEKEHQHIVDFLENNPFATTYIVGENFYKTKVTSTNINKFINFDKLKEELIQNPPKNSLLLIKGSRGMALERITEII